MPLSPIYVHDALTYYQLRRAHEERREPTCRERAGHSARTQATLCCRRTETHAWARCAHPGNGHRSTPTYSYGRQRGGEGGGRRPFPTCPVASGRRGKGQPEEPKTESASPTREPPQLGSCVQKQCGFVGNRHERCRYGREGLSQYGKRGPHLGD
jgi:hypothetical protein